MNPCVCCVFGHRNVEDSEELRERIRASVRTLVAKGVDTFLFGSKSAFDTLCYEIVSEFSGLKRVYVRAVRQGCTVLNLFGVYGMIAREVK